MKNDHRSKFFNLSNWKEEAFFQEQRKNGAIGHSSLSSSTAVQIYELFLIYFTSTWMITAKFRIYTSSIVSIYYLLTESEVITGKSQTEAFMY